MNRYLLGFLFVAAACGPNGGIVTHHDGGHTGDMGSPIMCVNGPKDSDGDGISDVDEGAPNTDTDGDGTPDYLDDDSDNDGIPDAIEGQTGGSCFHPIDSDQDGVPDFRDLDSDSAANNTIGDAEEAGPDPTNPVDTNHNGIPDYRDPDDDGDGIPDIRELTPTGSAVAATTLAMAPDTDGDGTPDFLDIDSDNDLITDGMEGDVDTDSDGLPNWRDLDSDGDCISDQIESGRVDITKPPVDTDGDGAPDFLDLDSDGEGLLDHLEDANCNGVVDACETDRVKQDTDGDGVNDLIEYEDCNVKTPAEQQQLMCQCWGSDPANNPLTAGDFVFVVDYMKTPSPTVETLNLSTNVSEADVIFSIDSTGSMQGSLNTLAGSISNTIIKQTAMKVPNVAFGVLDFKDFSADSSYVMSYDYRITTVNTAAGISGVQGALMALQTAGASGGGDGPEAGWEALYAIAGGPAMSATASSTFGSLGWSSTLALGSTKPLPVPAGETQGTVGGAGFRAGSVPIVVTVTDAEWHDAPNTPLSGDNGLNDYDPSVFASGAVPTRAAALARLNAINAHVIALAALSGVGSPKTRGINVANATGATVLPSDFGPAGVRPTHCMVGQCCTGWDATNNYAIGEAADGTGHCPLAFSFDDSTGNGVSGAVVSGIVALANGLKFDIHVQAVDVDPNTVNNFMLKLVPNLSGMGPAAVCITMPPSALQDNFTGPQATPGGDGTLDTFPGISGGVQVCFDVVPKMNTTVMNTNMPQFFRAQLKVLGVANGTTVNLGAPRDVFFLVPPIIMNGPIG